MTIRQWIHENGEDGKYLLTALKDWSLTELLSNLENELPREDESILNEQMERRKKGAPLQYLSQKAAFFGRLFYVDERVLIPRFDTEGLVQKTLELLPDEPKKILDLCTGSGCIGITLKLERPMWDLTMSDISGPALEVARRNAKKFQVKVNLIESDLFTDIGDLFDGIVSNPPYIKDETIPELSEEVKDYEPRLALSGGPDGLSFYHRIAKEAKNHLTEKGWLLLEIGDEEGREVSELLEKEGYENIQMLKDLADRDRYVIGRHCGH